MERRVEPRFQINSRVTVTVLGDPERSVECHLLDISATGMRLVSDDRILEDEVVALEVGDHSVLARVRRSHWRGDAYVIGAERIDAVPQDVPGEESEPAEPTKSDETPALVAEEAPEPEPESEPEPVEIAAEVPEEKPQWPEAVLAAPPEPLKVPENRPAAPLPMPEPAFSPRRSWRIPAALAASFAIAALGLAYFLQLRGRANVASAGKEPIELPAPAPPAPVTPPPAPAVKITPPPAPAVKKIPEQTAAVRVPPSSPSPAQAVPTDLSSPRVSSHKAEIKGLLTTWVAATADGKPVFGKLFAEGETQQLEFSRVAFLHIGAATGVEISIDGKPVGPLGRAGQMRLIELTPAGMQFLPWTNGDPVAGPNK